jgi:hypothetical protein
MELLLTGIQEETTRELMVDKDAQGFNEVWECVAKGADVTRKNRENIEEATGKPVVTEKNMLTERQKLNIRKNKTQENGLK